MQLLLPSPAVKACTGRLHWRWWSSLAPRACPCPVLHARQRAAGITACGRRRATGDRPAGRPASQPSTPHPPQLIAARLVANIIFMCAQRQRGREEKAGHRRRRANACRARIHLLRWSRSGSLPSPAGTGTGTTRQQGRARHALLSACICKQ
jgi:hypothetical protein